MAEIVAAVGAKTVGSHPMPATNAGTLNSAGSRDCSAWVRGLEGLGWWWSDYKIGRHVGLTSAVPMMASRVALMTAGMPEDEIVWWQSEGRRGTALGFRRQWEDTESCAKMARLHTYRRRFAMTMAEGSATEARMSGASDMRPSRMGRLTVDRMLNSGRRARVRRTAKRSVNPSGSIVTSATVTQRKKKAKSRLPPSLTPDAKTVGKGSETWWLVGCM